MKTYFWVAYALLLIGLFLWAEGRNRLGGHVVATAALNANRLLQDGDVRLDGGPFYLRRAVPAGGRIRAEDVRRSPSLQPPAGSLAIGLPLQPLRAGAAPINAGDLAHLCPARPDLAAPLTILAVLCDPAGAQCTAIAAVTPQQATAIAAQPAPGLSFARTCQ